jgi:uncharacterized repeat protein (TIGR01451 family)
VLVSLGLAAATVAPPAGAANIAVGCGASRVTDLVAAVDTANANAGPDTITLTAGCTYLFTAVNNSWYGPNALPAISSDITIEGNGAVLERSSSAGRLRFFYVGADPADPDTLGYVSPGAGSLTLHNLTLRGGLQKGGDSAYGGGGMGAGGAVFSQGTLTLDAVTASGNVARGGSTTEDPTAPAAWGGGGMGSDAVGWQAGFGNEGGGGGFSPNNRGGGGGGGFDGAGGGGNGFGVTDAGGQTTEEPAVGGNGGGAPTGTGGRGASSNFAGGAAGNGSGGGGGGVGWGLGGAGGAFGAGGQNSLDNRDGGGGGGVGGGGGAAGFANAGDPENPNILPSASGGGGFGGGGGSGVNGGANGGFGGGAGNGGFGGFGGVYGTNVGGAGAGLGGVVFNHQGTLTVRNTTMASNSAFGGTGTNGGGGFGGGGIFNLNGAVSIDSSTLAANDGGAVYNLGYDSATARSATVTLVHTILGDTPNGVPDLVVNRPATVAGGASNVATASGTAVTTSGPNIVETRSVQGGATFTGSPDTGDPGLGPLADNGGPGMETMLPGPNAIDAGLGSGCPATDERGITRPQNSVCDIGAVEVAAAPEASDVQVTKSDSPDPVTKGGSITYTITVTNLSDNGRTGVITLTDVIQPNLVFGSMTGTFPYDDATGAEVGPACTVPPVGARGTITCTGSLDGSGGTSPSAVFTLVLKVPKKVTSNSLSNTATVALSGDPDSDNDSDTEPTTVDPGPTTTTTPPLKTTTTRACPKGTVC